MFFDFLYQKKEQWEELTKTEIFYDIFSEGDYQEGKVNDLMFNLMSLLIQYLGQLEAEKSGDQSYYALEGMYERNMWSLLRIQTKKERKKVENEGIKDSRHFNRLSRIDRLIDDANSIHAKSHVPEYCENADRAMEIRFIIEKLRSCCYMLNRMKSFDFEYDLGMLSHLRDYLEAHWDYFGKIIVLNIYYEIVLSFLEPQDHDHFLNLVSLIEKHKGAFSLEDAKLIYGHAINIGVVYVNLDDIMFTKTTFRLYQLLMEDGLHMANREINHTMYKNIAVMACKVGEFIWAKEFMDSHKAYLDRKIRKNIYNFCLAFLYYNRKNYDGALELLRKVNFENVFYQINTKLMHLKIFYELKEYGVLLSFLESFRLFITRNKKVAPARREITLNLIRYSRKFILLKNEEGSKTRKRHFNNLRKLQTEMQEKDLPMLNKKWLADNIEESINKS